MRFKLLVITICLLACGCNADPRCRRETALLRAEILDLEDKYYLLKSKYDSAQNQLTALGGGTIVDEYYPEGTIISDGETIGSEIIHDGSTTGSYTNGDPIIYDQPELNAGDLNDDIIFDQPKLDYETTGTADDPMRSGGTTMSTGNSPENEVALDSPNLSVSHSKQHSHSQATEIYIHPSSTRGRNVDGVPGDEGIDLLVQTRTADGQSDLQPGELTVRVIDPTQAEGNQQIGLWKFLSTEVPLFFANDEIAEKGILLHLPWEEATPVNPKLVVHVSFLTSDGRTLTTSTQLRINPPSEDYSPDDPIVSGWTKRDPRWMAESRAGSRQTLSSRGAISNRQVDTAREGSISSMPSKANVDEPRWRPVR